MYGINYNGLRKKDTYDELIDYVMNKQEKIKYPNRRAKFLRESPQLSNLLDGDGEGVLEMEEQQKRQVQEVEKENSIREMASRSDGSTAELRATTKTRSFFTQTPPTKTEARGNQTMNPKMVNTESQAWRPNIASGGTQTDKPKLVREKQRGASYPDANQVEVYDMATEEFQNDMEEAINKSTEEELERNKKIKRKVETHLGEEVTQPILYLSSAQPASSSSSVQPAPSTTEQMNYSTQQKRSQSPDGGTKAKAKAKVNTQQKRSKSQEERANAKAKSKVNTQEKRNQQQDVNPKSKAKASKGDEVVTVEATAKPKTKATSRKGTKQEADNPEGPPRRGRSRPPPNAPAPPELTTTYEEGGASSSTTQQPAQRKAKAKAKATAQPKKTIDKDKKTGTQYD